MEGGEGQGSNASQGSRGSAGTEAPDEITKIPITVLTRIMHQAMPVNCKINADTKEAMSRCVSQFMAVVTHEAARVGKDESRRTMSGEDIITALDRLGLSNYVGPLSLLLQRYRESQGIVPRGSQAELRLLTPEAGLPAQAGVLPATPEVLQPPEPDLTLGLAPPGPRDMTALGLRQDVYKVWSPRAGEAMPPAGKDK